MVAWLATSPLPSEIRTPLHSQSPGTEGGEAVEMEGQTGVEGWTKGERGESGLMKWEERGMKGPSPNPTQPAAAGHYRYVHVDIEISHGVLHCDMKAGCKTVASYK